MDGSNRSDNQRLGLKAVVNNLEDAHEQIDTAISTALKESKPVYISVSCNLPAFPHPTFSIEHVPYFLSPMVNNQLALEAAVNATAEILGKAVKPVLVGGPKLRVAKAQQAFVKLADACRYPLNIADSGYRLLREQLQRSIILEADKHLTWQQLMMKKLTLAKEENN